MLGAPTAAAPVATAGMAAGTFENVLEMTSGVGASELRGSIL